jgi:hypothetical protein
MGRQIVGVVVGLVAAGVAVMLIEAMAGFDPAAPDLSLVRVEAVASIAVAWILGPLIGGLVATVVGMPAGPVLAFIVGFFLLVADIANLLMIPSPAWLWVVGILAPLPSAWLGFVLARRRRRPIA